MLFQYNSYLLHKKHLCCMIQFFKTQKLIFRNQILWSIFFFITPFDFRSKYRWILCYTIQILCLWTLANPIYIMIIKMKTSALKDERLKAVSTYNSKYNELKWFQFPVIQIFLQRSCLGFNPNWRNFCNSSSAKNW